MTVIVDTGVLVALIDLDAKELAWAREEATSPAGALSDE